MPDDSRRSGEFNANPYRSPGIESAASPFLHVAISASIVYSKEYVEESLARYRRYAEGGCLFLTGRLIAAVFFTSMAAIGLLSGQFIMGSILGFLAVLTVFGRKIENWENTRSLKGTEQEMRITLSDTRIEIVLNSGERKYTWKMIRRAILFDDGVLLCPKSDLPLWLPKSAFKPTLWRELNGLVSHRVSVVQEIR